MLFVLILPVLLSFKPRVHKGYVCGCLGAGNGAPHFRVVLRTRFAAVCRNPGKNYENNTVRDVGDWANEWTFGWGPSMKDVCNFLGFLTPFSRISRNLLVMFVRRIWRFLNPLPLWCGWTSFMNGSLGKFCLLVLHIWRLSHATYSRLWPTPSHVRITQCSTMSLPDP